MSFIVLREYARTMKQYKLINQGNHTLFGLGFMETIAKVRLPKKSFFLAITCTEVSGVENIGQCGRLSQLGWLLGAL